MIIVGYPCIGKSTYAVSHKYKAIDLESSNFIKDGSWVESYCNVAIGLSEQGYDVFVSSHDDVRKQLLKVVIRISLQFIHHLKSKTNGLRSLVIDFGSQTLTRTIVHGRGLCITTMRMLLPLRKMRNTSMDFMKSVMNQKVSRMTLHPFLMNLSMAVN